MASTPSRVIKSPSSKYFYPWPIVLVSCISESRGPNIITIGASSICSSSPPTVGIAVSPRRYSHGLISSVGDFGVNIPRADQVEQTDYCGTHSGRNIDKFEAVGFTVAESTQIASPLILECPVSMECKLVETVGLGSHDWMIGEIVAVHVDESALTAEGELDPTKANPLLSFWGRYWNAGEPLDSWHRGQQK